MMTYGGIDLYLHEFLISAALLRLSIYTLQSNTSFAPARNQVTIFTELSQLQLLRVVERKFHL